MNSLNIELTAQLKVFVDQQVESGSYSNAGDYIRDLIVEDQQRKSRQIEEQLLAAIDGPPSTPWTRDDLDLLKRKVRERLEEKS